MYYNKNPDIFIGKEMFMDFNNPNVKCGLPLMIMGCKVFIGSFDFGFYLQ